MLTIKLLEEQYNIKIISKNNSWFMKTVGWLLTKTKITPNFMDKFWTTYRFPFNKAIIAYPVLVQNPIDEQYRSILEHELVHVDDMKSSWGLFKTYCLLLFFPLPILFSGRWWIERDAYLLNLTKHQHLGYDINYVVDVLWNNYLYPYPRSLMRKWFEKKMLEHKAKEGK